PCYGSDGRRNLNLSLFGLCSTDYGIPLEFSSAFSMVHGLHTKCRLTQIELSYSWVKQALQGAGLVARGCKRGVHRKRRPRRPLPGMLLHIEGRRHRWFQDERWYDLIVILDDATSEIY